MSRFIHKIGKVVPSRTTLSAATVTEVGEFNHGRTYMYLENEDSADMWYGLGSQNSTTADFTDARDMQIIKAGEPLHFSDGAIPTGKIYAYSVAGGVIKFGEFPIK